MKLLYKWSFILDRRVEVVEIVYLCSSRTSAAVFVAVFHCRGAHTKTARWWHWLSFLFVFHLESCLITCCCEMKVKWVRIWKSCVIWIVTSEGDHSCYETQVVAKLVNFLQCGNMRTESHTTHTHAGSVLSLSLSLFLIKPLSGLFSILMWFVILCQHLTSQAVGIRLIQREANCLWLTAAEA